MHPALSVIAFTTFSGAGYGLLIWLGVVALHDYSISTAAALTIGGVGVGLVTAGLLSSLAHLGRPERAWRALSQWRSSWLSREGVAAILSYAPALYVTAALAGVGPRAGLVPAGALLVATSLATLVCTARIYSSLKTVLAWHNAWTLPGYLLQAAWTGTGLAWLWNATFGHFSAAIFGGVFTLLTVLVAAHTLGYRRWRAHARSTSTLATATGLGSLGALRSFERPHTEENYLLREMGFVLARKHARRLAQVVFAGTAVALAAAAGALALPRAGLALAAVASIAALLATFVERWTFFAQARHVVTLYYGVERGAS